MQQTQSISKMHVLTNLFSWVKMLQCLLFLLSILCFVYMYVHILTWISQSHTSDQSYYNTSQAVLLSFRIRLTCTYDVQVIMVAEIPLLYELHCLSFAHSI